MGLMQFLARLLLLAAIAVTPSAAAAQDLPSGPISLARGRITLGADLSISATPSDDEEGAWFNYTDYERNALRLLRLGVTADVRIAERLSLLTEIRSENGDSIEPYALYVRVRPWRDRRVDIQAGRIPPTFGAFARRDYAVSNPLIGYPLAYQYLTSIRPDALPASSEDVLRMRARGWRPNYPIGSLDVATGLPLISAFRWDTGVQVRVGPDTLNAGAALTSGTVSDPHIRDNNGGKQVSGRVQWQPAVGLTLGGSAARGPYLADAALATAALVASRENSIVRPGSGQTQHALGVDAEYSRDYWMVRGEVIWNRWQVPTLSQDLTAASLFVEGRYKIVPGMFVAGRVDRLTFSRLSTTGQNRPWDAPVTRIETGVGYYLRPNLLAKGAYQHNWRDGGQVRTRGLLAAQLQFWL
jgi:hypothetical protein